MPAYQGEFDGLCGMYSIANAYESCGYIDHGNQLFQVACSRLAPKRWPRVLWEGTSFHDMMRMIKACQRYICQERLVPWWFDIHSAKLILSPMTPFGNN